MNEHVTEFVMFFYPEGAVGNIDFTPGDDDGVFDGFGGNVNTEVRAVSVICDLYVDGETLCILKAQTQFSLISDPNSTITLKRIIDDRHLSVELQLSSAGFMSIDGEICRFVDDAAQRLQTWSVTLHLRRGGIQNVNKTSVKWFKTIGV